MTQKQYAILTLQAPMMSFGVTAVDERRPTGIFPGRSMLTGLIANALGWRRQDYQKLQELQERIRYAVRVEHDNSDEDGVTIIHDLQTVELHKDDKAWTTSGKPEGRDGSKKTYDSPELRTLEYVANSRAVVALRLESPEEHPTLEEVGHALQWPARPLHIGRKCCIPETMIFTGFTGDRNRHGGPNARTLPVDRLCYPVGPGRGRRKRPSGQRILDQRPEGLGQQNSRGETQDKRGNPDQPSGRRVGEEQ